MKFLILFIFPIFIFSQTTLLDIRDAELKQRINQENYPIEVFTENQNIDVLHYTLHLNINPAQTVFSGTTDIKFKVLESTNQITFDAVDFMNITDIVMDEVSLYNNANHVGDLLEINLPNMLNIDEIKTISVSYGSSTGNAYNRSIHGPNSASIIYTFSQPYFAKEWYVCKDNLQDKADEGVDVYVTHPSAHKAASNGLLISRDNNGNGTYTTHWKHSYPIPAYLVAIAVTNYAEYNFDINIDRTTLPIIKYIYPEDNDEISQWQLDEIGDYMQFMSSTFGPYPYPLEKYGHAQWEWFGGMEHATMSFMYNFSEVLSIHELAHQWFGDKVTCGTWNDIWLNEGFATYCSGLYYDYKGYNDDFRYWKYSMIGDIIEYANGSVYIPMGTSLTPERILNYRLSYQKASMVLHMLRFKIGDGAFYQGIQNYLNDPELAYNFALTPQLQAHLETTSGESLEEFFNDWVYGTGYPQFDFHLASNADGSYTLQANQTTINSNQNLIETPYEITFYGNNNERLKKRFDCNADTETFEITDIPFEVSYYYFNFDWDIIAQASEITLNTEDVENQQIELTISPNPAKEFFTIKTDEPLEEIKVFSISGQLVYEAKKVSQNPVIHIQNWNPGIYIVEINSDSGKTTEKLMVN